MKRRNGITCRPFCSERISFYILILNDDRITITTPVQLEILLYVESIVNYVELLFFQFYWKIKKRNENQ